MLHEGGVMMLCVSDRDGNATIITVMMTGNEPVALKGDLGKDNLVREA